jgi:hypothetical protein
MGQEHSWKPLSLSVDYVRSRCHGRNHQGIPVFCGFAKSIPSHSVDPHGDRRPRLAAKAFFDGRPLI